VSYWVATEIILAPVHLRAAYIEKFINIGEKCLHNYNNFNTLMAIISGLNNSAISRLKKNWMAISDKAKETFKKLEELMTLDSNFKRYREFVATKTSPVVPYMGSFVFV